MEKLQELCLDKIAASFEIYYHAYSKSPNEALKKGILFLQKVYSDKLILRLYKKGLMQEKYVHLVFTKYLKALNTEWLANCSWRTIVETFARIGPTLEEVCFGGHHINSTQWGCVLPHLPNVKEVTYKKLCYNAFFEGLAHYCPKLEKLNVKGSTYVSDVGLGYICGIRNVKKTLIAGDDKSSDPENKGNVPCPLLKEIVLESTAVGKEGVKRLIKEVPSLEKIACPYLPYVLHEIHTEDSGSSHEAVACKITHLDMASMSRLDCLARRHEIFKSCVSMCPNLTSAICHILSSEDLNLFCKLKFLRKLELHCWKSDVVRNSFLREMIAQAFLNSLVVVNDFLRQMGAQLTDLSLHGCSVSFSVLRQCCPQLEELTLNSLSIEDDDDDEVDSNLMFPYLETFRFEDIDFFNPDNSRAISRILTSSPKLENLNIRISMLEYKACITDEVESAICKRCEMPAFKAILFQRCVKGEFLRRIFSVCSPMQRVYLQDVFHVDHVREIAATVPNIPKILVSEVPYSEFSNDFVDL